MVGYVLLVSFAVIIGGITYKWMSTYTPKDIPECPEGVSLYLKEARCVEGILYVTLQNNGLFKVDGYYIKATTQLNQKVATLDLTKEDYYEGGDQVMNSVIIKQSFNPGSEEEVRDQFDLTSLETGPILSIEITPAKAERYENRNIHISCEQNQIKKEITCPESS